MSLQVLNVLLWLTSCSLVSCLVGLLMSYKFKKELKRKVVYMVISAIVITNISALYVTSMVEAVERM